MEEGDKNVLIQQRIKKMLQNKKRNQTKESGELTKRLGGTLAEKQSRESDEPDEELVKPQSSVRLRRPVSAVKAVSSTNNLPILPSNKNDVDVRPLIMTAFDYSPKLKDFLKDNKLNGDKERDRLTNNQLFILATVSKLKSVLEDKHGQVVEKQVIAKIQRTLEWERQQQRCVQAQNRINKMMDERLKALSKY